MSTDRNNAVASAPNSSGFVLYHVPRDQPELLVGVGVVALRHAHLDHTIKTLADVTIVEALDALEFEGSSVLRERIKRLARTALGEGAALIKVQALMKRCQDATLRRNDLMHSIWYKDLDDESRGVTDGKGRRDRLPTVEELTSLGNEIMALITELNEARLGGYISEALVSARPNT